MNINSRNLDLTSNKSHIPIDLFKQIKKKSEVITTTGNTSIKLIQNLSNPTNLTNPQIISLTHLNESQDSSTKNNSRNLNKNNNSKLKFSSNSSEITLPPLKSSDDVDNDFIEELLQKVENDFNIEKRNKIQLKKINSETDIGNLNEKQKKLFLSEFNFVNDKNIIEEDIWEKAKKAKYLSPQEKDKKTKVYRYFSKQEFISRIKQINLMKYIRKESKTLISFIQNSLLLKMMLFVYPHICYMQHIKIHKTCNLFTEKYHKTCNI